MELSGKEKSDLFKREQAFLEDWYQWQDISEKVLKEGLTPEIIIALNDGFGTPDSAFFGLGDKIKDEKSKTYVVKNLKIYLSKKIKFHKHLRFYKLHDTSTQEVKLAFLPQISSSNSMNVLGQNSGLLIDDTNTPVYEANKESVFWLKTELEILDYVKFFFFHIAGRHGRFYIFYKLDEIEKLVALTKLDEVDKKNVRSKKVVKKIKAIEDDIKNIHILNLDNDKSDFIVENVYMLFKGSVFKAIVKINKDNGVVSMYDDKLILEDL